MDRQLLERMVGAGVLLIALIIIAPAILDGRREGDVTAYPGEANRAGEVRRTHTIRLDRSPDGPPVARPLTDTAPARGAKKLTGSQARTDSGAGKTTVGPGSTRTASAKTASAKTASTKTGAAGSAATASKPASAKKPVTSAATNPPRRPASGWSVQLGSFAQQDNARRLAKEVEAGGFKTLIVPLKGSSRTLYRVRIGSEDTREQALELATRLEKAGYKGQVAPP